MTKVLVTGGAGFIGSHLVDALVDRGCDVTVVDVLHPQVHGGDRSPPAYVNRRARLVVGDVRDEALLDKEVADADVVFHLAANTGVGQSMYAIRDYLDANLVGTGSLLEVVTRRRRPPKLILSSSRAVYGEGAGRCPSCGLVDPAVRSLEHLRRGEWEVTCPCCGGPVTPVATPETKPPSSGSVYALTKEAQEKATTIVARSYDVPAVLLRYFNVYGPRQSLSNQYTGVITAFVTRVLNGRPPEVYEDGRETRDFVHVDDVVQANLAAMENDDAVGATLNVGSGEALPMLDVATIVSTAMGGPPPVVTGKFRSGDVRHCFADLTRSREILGYVPTTAFADGIRELVDQIAGQHWEDLSSVAEQELWEHGLGGQFLGDH